MMVSISKRLLRQKEILVKSSIYFKMQGLEEKTSYNSTDLRIIL